ncbi:hypothetical protein DICPUDRAFT_20605, partial [Dictyostelium purpureum]
VKELIIENGFDQPILPNIIPLSVKSLTVSKLTHPLVVGSIPSSIVELTLNEEFDQTIDSANLIIPNTIKKLTLFNHKVQIGIGVLPEGLEEIELKDGYSHPIPIGWFPSSVETLHVGNIKQPLVENLIPETIQDLFLTENFNQIFNHNIIP